MVRRTLCADVRAGNAGCAQSGLVWGGKGVESDSVRVESARKGGARLWAPPVGHRHLGLAGVLSSTTTFSGEITAIFGSDVLSRLGF